MRAMLYFDVEWSNSKNKSICQIGLMSEDFDTGDPVFPELDLYINPDDGFDLMCVNVHHINESRVINEPKFDEAWKMVEKYFTNSIIVGHNVCGADLDALVKNLKRYGLNVPVMYYIDTLEIAKDYIHPTLSKYDLGSLCKYYGIDIDNAHNAFDDACACSDLLKALINEFGFCIDEYIRKYNNDNDYNFEKYACLTNVTKDLNTLYGYVIGFEMDKKIDEEEKNILIGYLERYKGIKNHDGLSKIFNVLEKILSDGIVTIEEIERFKSALITFVYTIEGSIETLATQKLQGILDGIISDNELSQIEIIELQKWLYENDYLRGHYPYDVLCKKIEEILEDGIVTYNEQQEMIEVFSNLINPLENLKKKTISFENNSFCLTGDFIHGAKAIVEEHIIGKGGVIHKSPKKSTNYVVVGGYGSAAYSNGSYGTKVKKALELGITVIKEEDLYK